MRPPSGQDQSAPVETRNIVKFFSKHHRRAAVILAAFISASTTLAGQRVDSDGVHSQEEESRTYVEIVQELFQSEVVYPQEKGEFQLTLGPSFHRERARDFGRISFLVEYGLTDSWELGVKWDVWAWSKPRKERTTSGVGDVELETKYSFMNIGGSNFHAAIGLGGQFCTGSVSHGISEGFIEFEPFVVVARDFSSFHHAQVFAQAGLSLLHRAKSAGDSREAEPAAHELQIGGGFLLPFGSFVFSGEVTWSNNRWNHGDENECYITPGLTWKLPGDWELGAGVPVGLTDDSDPFRIILQITKEF
jgi:hypothetical protein